MTILHPFPIPKVSYELRGKDRHYTITLNKEHLNDLAFVDSSSGLVCGYAADRTGFILFHSMNTDDSFRPMPNAGTQYYAYIGDMRIRTIADMVKLLRNNSPMPIHLPSPIPSDPTPTTVGYVHFKTVFGSVDETLK